jgi:hypothetical protein
MSEIEDGWFAFKIVWGLFLTIVGAVSMKTIGRVDKLEETRVQKEDHEREVARVRDDHLRNIARVEESIKDLRTEMQTGFNRVFTRLDEFADRFAG